MLKIGEFSKLSRVSVRMLRHYDEVGLLAPSEVDPMTGYRYYSERQLITAGRIAALRALGFGLSETRELLRLYDDRAALDARLAAQHTRLEALAADTAQKLRLLDTAREWLRKEADMNYNVTIRTLPERYAACVRMTIPCYDAEGMVWDVLCRETDHMHLVPDDPCYCSVTFLDEEYKERDVLIEASKTVRGRYPDTEHVRVPDAAARHVCRLRVPRQLRADQRRDRGRRGVGRGQRLRERGADVQHLPRQPARDAKP